MRKQNIAYKQTNKKKLTDIFPHPETIAALPALMLLDDFAKVTIFAFGPKDKGVSN